MRNTKYNRTVHRYFNEVLRRCPDIDEYNALKSILIDVAKKERDRIRSIINERTRNGKQPLCSKSIGEQ